MSAGGSALSGTVVVTGAASGIGRTVVELILERDPGAVVVGLDLTAPDIQVPGTEEPAGTADARFIGRAVDVTDVDGVAEVFCDIAGDAPPLRGLVCAAGILHREPTEQLPLDEWRRMVGVHLDGTFLVSQQARWLMEQGGSIVMLSSVAEWFGWPERAAYAAAKAGISSLARSLAVEWAGDGIRVNTVAPGYVDTPLIAAARERGDLHTDPAALHAVHRLAQPREIAAPIRFLLTDDASFITGETLVVDGGYRIFKGV